MNGTIEIESEKSKGTSVSVYLPYQEATEPQLVTAEKEEKDLSLINQKRILVAEDNQFNRLLLEMIFQKNHFSYSMAVNGIEAVERAEAENFDLIFMDIQMPEMDGLTATRLIRQTAQNAKVRIVAMTANALATDYQDCLDAGMNDYISKPISIQDIVRIISEC